MALAKVLSRCKYLLKTSYSSIAIGLILVAALMASLFTKTNVHNVVLPQRLNAIATTIAVPASAPDKVPYPRLFIPGLSITAPILAVGLTSGGAMAVPKSAAAVGWYKLGPYPGHPGSAVIAGHVRATNGSAGVFQNLAKLAIGDKVEVETAQDKAVTFIVRQKRSYNPDDRPSEVFNRTDGTYLNLITCEGTWDQASKTYTSRLVVFASTK